MIQHQLGLFVGGDVGAVRHVQAVLLDEADQRVLLAQEIGSPRSHGVRSVERHHAGPVVVGRRRTRRAPAVEVVPPVGVPRLPREHRVLHQVRGVARGVPYGERDVTLLSRAAHQLEQIVALHPGGRDGDGQRRDPGALHHVDARRHRARRLDESLLRRGLPHEAAAGAAVVPHPKRHDRVARVGRGDEERHLLARRRLHGRGVYLDPGGGVWVVDLPCGGPRPLVLQHHPARLHAVGSVDRGGALAGAGPGGHGAGRRLRAWRGARQQGSAHDGARRQEHQDRTERHPPPPATTPAHQRHAHPARWRHPPTSLGLPSRRRPIVEAPPGEPVTGPGARPRRRPARQATVRPSSRRTGRRRRRTPRRRRPPPSSPHRRASPPCPRPMRPG